MARPEWPGLEEVDATLPEVASTEYPNAAERGSAAALQEFVERLGALQKAEGGPARSVDEAPAHLERELERILEAAEAFCDFLQEATSNVAKSTQAAIEWVEADSGEFADEAVVLMGVSPFERSALFEPYGGNLDEFFTEVRKAAADVRSYLDDQFSAAAVEAQQAAQAEASEAESVASPTMG